MSVVTKPATSLPMPALETDLLMQNLIKSLDLARSMQLPMLEQIIEMALIELGRKIAAQEKSARDRDMH